jgi:hypothetical protein
MADGEPEDWPASPPELRGLERALRCSICYDLYTGPVALPCGHTCETSHSTAVYTYQRRAIAAHAGTCTCCTLRCAAQCHKGQCTAATPQTMPQTYIIASLRCCLLAVCSRCIRDAFAVRIRDGQLPGCPSCRASCDQADLRPVVHLREAAAAWSVVRPLLLQQHSRSLEMQDACKEQEVCEQQQRSMPRSSRSRHRRCQQPQQQQQQPLPACRDASCQMQPAQLPCITISSDAGLRSTHSGSVSASSDSCDSDSAATDSRTDPDWRADSAGDGEGRRNRPASLKGKRGAHDSGGGSDGDWGEFVGDSQDDTMSRRRAQAQQQQQQAAPQQQQQPKRQRSGGKPAPPQNHDAQHGDTRQAATVPTVAAGCTAPAGQQQQQPQQQQQQQHGYVACPICGLSVRETFINSHVDGCLVTAGQHVQRPVAAQATTASGSNKGNASLLPHSGASSGTAGRCDAASALTAPPKLCFELMKERELKSKLAGLGISSDGSKKACQERYTSFRSYVLSLKDACSTMSLAAAAAEFSKQQRRVARAVSRPPQLPGALAAAAAAAGAAAVGCGAAAAANKCSASSAVAAAAAQHGLPAADSSYAALIAQTREQLRLRKQQQQQQQTDPTAQDTAVQTQAEPGTAADRSRSLSPPEPLLDISQPRTRCDQLGVD